MVVVVARADIIAVLETIPDPEMPISIVELGIVESVEVEPRGADRAVRVTVDILPTFVGCPALPMIEKDIRTRLAALDGVRDVDVRFRFDPAWTVDRISPEGRRRLAEHGVRVPEPGSAATPAGVQLTASALPCPFCGSARTRMDSPFGPTRCRTIWYCEACQNPFEGLKRV